MTILKLKLSRRKNSTSIDYLKNIIESNDGDIKRYFENGNESKETYTIENLKII